MILGRVYKTAYHERRKAKERRETLKEAGACINGPKHPTPRKGVRCDDCKATHTASRGGS